MRMIPSSVMCVLTMPRVACFAGRLPSRVPLLGRSVDLCLTPCGQAAATCDQATPSLALAAAVAGLPALPAQGPEAIQHAISTMVAALEVGGAATDDTVAAGAWLSSVLSPGGSGAIPATDHTTCASALRALELLALQPDTATALLPVVPAVLAALSRYERVASVVGAGLAFLGALSSQDDMEVPLLSTAPMVVKALRRHGKTEDVALCGLLCLCNLTACEEGQATLWPVAGRSLVTLMDTHVESVEAVTRCLACMRNIAGVDSNLVLLAAAVPSVRAALLQHGDEESVVESAVAFLAMLGAEEALVDSLVPAIPTVLAALNAHEAAPELVHVGLAFLASVSHAEQAVGVLGRVAPRLLALMQLHADRTDVLEQGLGLLQNLCGQPVAQEALLPLVAPLHTLVVTHEGRRTIVAGVLACFRSLCGAGAGARRALADTAACLVDALQDFGVEDADIAEAALVCLAFLCEDPAYAASLVPVLPILVPVLEAHVEVVAVAGPAMGCLTAITAGPGGPPAVAPHLLTVLDAMHAHEDLEVACEGVGLLLALAQDPQCVGTMAPAIPVLLAALEVHGTHPGLAAAVLGGLAALASRSELVPQVVLAVPLVLAAVRVHRHAAEQTGDEVEVEVLGHAVAFLDTLSQRSDVCEALAPAVLALAQVSNGPRVPSVLAILHRIGQTPAGAIQLCAALPALLTYIEQHDGPAEVLRMGLQCVGLALAAQLPLESSVEAQAVAMALAGVLQHPRLAADGWEDIVHLAVGCMAQLAAADPWRSAALSVAATLLPLLSGPDSVPLHALSCLTSLAAGPPADWMPALLPALGPVLAAARVPGATSVAPQALALLGRMLPWMDLAECESEVRDVLEVVHTCLAHSAAPSDSLAVAAGVVAVAGMLPYITPITLSSGVRQVLVPACIAVLESAESQGTTVEAPLQVLALLAMEWDATESAAAAWVHAVLVSVDRYGFALSVARASARCFHNISCYPVGAAACRYQVSRLLPLLCDILEVHGVDRDVTCSTLACMCNACLLPAGWAVGQHLGSSHLVDVLGATAAQHWDDPEVTALALVCMADTVSTGRPEEHAIDLVFGAATEVLQQKAAPALHSTAVCRGALAALWASLQLQQEAGRSIDSAGLTALALRTMDDHVHCGEVVQAGAGCLCLLLPSLSDESDALGPVWATLVTALQTHGCGPDPSVVWTLVEAATCAHQAIGFIPGALPAVMHQVLVAVGQHPTHAGIQGAAAVLLAGAASALSEAWDGEEQWQDMRAAVEQALDSLPPPGLEPALAQALTKLRDVLGNS